MDEIPVNPFDSLTEKQKAFCREYIYDWNATRAYKAVYPDAKSDAGARASSSDLLTNPNINDYIEFIQRDLEKLAGISRLMVANEFKKIGFSSIANLHNTWIEKKEFEQLTTDQREAIQEIETKVIKQRNAELSIPGHTVYDDVEYVKIRLFDKNKALENLNKMLGYNAPDKVDLTSLGKELQSPTLNFMPLDE
jgi:phage terminase small subunit